MVYAGGGDDSVFGGLGRDILRGQAGDDRLSGSDGNDIVYGNVGADLLAGGDGRDRPSATVPLVAPIRRAQVTSATAEASIVALDAVEQPEDGALGHTP